jgi:cellulose synthase/poly-beta-1,6-N-acetylglucosamine synthase-like glycosyltransferase
MAVPDNTRYLGPRGFDQANFTLSADQRNVIILLVLGVIILFIQAGTGPALLIINSIFTIFFLVSTTYRLSLIDMSLRSRGEIKIDGKLEPPHGEWPEYVIQVPLYKEATAIPHLIESLTNLDYPKNKLTIQLLVEADDEATKGAVETANIELPFVVIDIPVSYPRTKPKACNVGLATAKGDYLVIYDAEDRPDPDQLKKAVIGFSQCEREVACIQAKLNFYNTERNLLTRCFSAEYAMWFDLCLPGLDALRAPIPLGGTSNHFRLEVLTQLKGWDEYNVTEDCDLGLRLFSQGWQTRILDSTTWEEACPKLTWWIKQRSRWVKGYMQTYLVHTRDILGLTKKLGIVNSMHFHLLIGGSVLAQLLSTIYWILVCVWLGWRPDIIGTFFPGPIFAMAALCLFVGNFAFVYTCAIACECRVGLGKVVKYTPLMVIYWIIMSVAGWKGALQLIWKPHFWEKTQHHAD